jgi:hypothetical protein
MTGTPASLPRSTPCSRLRARGDLCGCAHGRRDWPTSPAIGYCEAIAHSGITLAAIIGEALTQEITEGEINPLIRHTGPAASDTKTTGKRSLLRH